MKYEIGRRICQYRKEQGLSQREFAELIGASNSRVSNWEQGRNGPDADILADICRVLKVSPSELLDIHLSDSEDQLSGQERKVLRAYRQKPELQNILNEKIHIYKLYTSCRFQKGTPNSRVFS